MACCPESGYTAFRRLVLLDLRTEARSSFNLSNYAWFTHVQPAWTSDRQALRYTMGGAIYRLPLDGSPEELVTADPRFEHLGVATEAPDGMLVVVGYTPGTSGIIVYKQAPDGTKQVLCSGISTSCNYQKAWHGDGEPRLVNRWPLFDGNILSVGEDVLSGDVRWEAQLIGGSVVTSSLLLVSGNGTSSVHVPLPRWVEIQPQANAWGELRPRLPAAARYRPGWLPERFAAPPILLSPAAGQAGASYLVAYRATNRDLLLLGSGPISDEWSREGRTLQAGALEATIWRDGALVQASWTRDGQRYWLQLMRIGPAEDMPPAEQEVEQILAQLAEEGGR